MPTGCVLGGGRLGGPREGVLRNRVVLGGRTGQRGSARGQAGPVETRPGLHSAPGWPRLSRKVHGSPDPADVHRGGLGLPWPRSCSQGSRSAVPEKCRRPG